MSLRSRSFWFHPSGCRSAAFPRAWLSLWRLAPPRSAPLRSAAVALSRPWGAVAVLGVVPFPLSLRSLGSLASLAASAAVAAGLALAPARSRLRGVARLSLRSPRRLLPPALCSRRSSRSALASLAWRSVLRSLRARPAFSVVRCGSLRFAPFPSRVRPSPACRGLSVSRLPPAPPCACRPPRRSPFGSRLFLGRGASRFGLARCGAGGASLRYASSPGRWFLPSLPLASLGGVGCAGCGSVGCAGCGSVRTRWGKCFT